MRDCHGPQTGVSKVWPVDHRVQHHHSGDQHDCPDCAFSCTIVVVSSSASKMENLLELAEMFGKSFGGKLNSIIAQVLLQNKAVITTQQLELLFALECLFSVQVTLEFHVDIVCHVINKDAPAIEHVILLDLPMRCKEMALCGANKVLQ